MDKKNVIFILIIFLLLNVIFISAMGDKKISSDVYDSFKKNSKTQIFTNINLFIT